MNAPTSSTLHLESIVLSAGGHDAESGEHCLLEVVSMFAGEPFGDSPMCVDPVLAAFGRAWNDGMRTDEERAQLKQYIHQLVGTAGSAALSEKRSWMAFDWLVRVQCAAWLALTPALKVHADILISLPAITCKAELDIALPKIDAAWAAAGAAAGAAAWDAAGAAAWAAAGAAAWAAAGAAAGDAARAAAGDAAGAAAGDAARAAAGDAAWAAARAAARDALEPTVKTLQASAHELFARMISAK
ncbi:hypothetical protein PIN31115_02059 [Pandoraea iniqua]|uniref:Uncharacterized protein n=1 Tax=Pandoraea iniqua TaxID=2508288 RepID=A0A5E4UP27_9BURK|nr:hypothetical protein [Pandoraea iniqua]VVE00120.1 hypothetical protein PIN31115_02059 [Pandoraea iniqua]